ncbi:hypothetical protein [Kitasatospora sp. NPDC088134]|uniref:hypothetical protein n=1 Tax=Kitasatospora sp. NPDC088134 TaxID=3364071 RepID=UPI0037F42650
MHLDKALRVGDYLQIASYRWSVDGTPDGEGYARIERVEHIPPADGLLDQDAGGLFNTMARGKTMVAVFCQGMPGPLLLRGGDHRTADAIDARRLARDAADPTWTPGAPLLFRDAAEPLEAHWSRTEPAPPAALPAEAGPDRPRAPRRAATFTKPVRALKAGDYLQIHAHRHPAADMGVDEGFHRVEAVHHLPAEHLPTLLADPARARDGLVLAAVHGVPGTLILTGTDATVLTAPNPERRRNDETDPWTGGTLHHLTGATTPDPAAQQQADRAMRPEAPDGEMDLYPSQFTDPGARTLHMDGVTGTRPVPLAALPWPHHQHKCAYTARGKALARTYPDGRREDQVARAELFSRLTPAEFAACPRHEADNWPAIARAALALALAEQSGDPEHAARAGEMDHLTPRDRAWARTMVGPAGIIWDDGAEAVTDGQHRLCALRAAGVETAPVFGCYLPDQLPAPHQDAARQARRTVEAYWQERLAELVGPGRLAGALARTVARHPALRMLLPRPGRRAD